MSYLKKKNIQVYMDFCKGSLKITKQIKKCVYNKKIVDYILSNP